MIIIISIIVTIISIIIARILKETSAAVRRLLP